MHSVFSTSRYRSAQSADDNILYIFKHFKYFYGFCRRMEIFKKSLECRDSLQSIHIKLIFAYVYSWTREYNCEGNFAERCFSEFFKIAKISSDGTTTLTKISNFIIDYYLSITWKIIYFFMRFINIIIYLCNTNVFLQFDFFISAI